MDLKSMSLEDFDLRLNLSDQTDLVNNLIQITKNSEEDLSLYIKNLETINFQMPIGKIELPSDIYYHIKDQHSTIYHQLKTKEKQFQENQQDTSEIKAQLEKLNSNIELFENGSTNKIKEVLEWRLLPNWITEYFLHKGEAILEYKGCSWWGITDIKYTGDHARNFVREIYNENFNASHK